MVGALTGQKTLNVDGPVTASRQLCYLAWRVMDQRQWQDTNRSLNIDGTKWEGKSGSDWWVLLAEFLWAWDARVARRPRSVQEPEQVRTILRSQIEMWRDLLLMAADPTSFPDVGTIGRASRRSKHILAFFSPEIIVGLFASSGLGVSIYYLTGVGTKYAAIGAALSALGLSGSAASGTIKSFSQGVTTRLRDAASQDAVIKMIKRLPPRRVHRRANFRAFRRAAPPLKAAIAETQE